MGAGKTTVGVRLARRLSLPFVDSDAEIERASGRSVAELFEAYGESEFRDGERRVIARLMDGTSGVVATGGGAFMDERTRALILARAHAIWLDAAVDDLVARTAKRPGQRPLLQNGDPRAILSRLAAIRNPIYAQAHIHICNRSLNHKVAVDAIVRALELMTRSGIGEPQPREVFPG